MLQRKVSRSREESYLQVQTKCLGDSQDLIVSEDLKVKKMFRNHKLASGIADVGWGSFFILLPSRKAVLYGKEYMKVPAKDTTQTCSGCGHVMKGEEKIPLGAEEWTCPVCGMHHLRDYNAARNVLQRGGLAVKALQI